ncbi:MAG TPA: hypothetical protein VFZ00_34900 [Solirubrobacter sp.]|nr:hypothetical protein [Solirubrobacter sp.]
MVIGRVVVLALSLLVVGAPGASAAQEVAPRPGVLLTGRIQFPRPQEMAVQVDAADGSKMTAYLGFNGACKGGRIAELWAAGITASPTVRVSGGRFAATLTGTKRNLGGVARRTGKFRWRFVGRFVAPDVVTATVSGSAELRMRGKRISRCKIAKPAPVRLTLAA